MIDLSKETEALAQRIALAKRVAVDDVVREALQGAALAAGLSFEQQRARDKSADAVAVRRARIDEIVQAVAALPILDSRSTQELIDELNAL